MSRLAVPLLLLVACAAPQETSPTMGPPSTQPAAANSEDEQVCREEVPTGSLVARTVCRSRSQIDQEREDGQEFQRKGNILPPQPPRRN
jgi:hypothetical protein